MSRRKIREQLFKLLFRVEFNTREEMPEQEQLFFEEEDEQSPEENRQIEDKFHAILERLEEIDGLLNEKVDGWDTARMGKVDLTILRLAVYEINYDETVPTGVAINEAVEIAKKFGQNSSPSFVNGVLAKFA